MPRQVFAMLKRKRDLESFLLVSEFRAFLQPPLIRIGVTRDPIRRSSASIFNDCCHN
jgi:hypothetical protein